jgi:hypothetical protein
MLSTFAFYHWDYWQLYHKVTFDGVNRLILINPEVTSIDVQRDIYSSWKEWSRLETNLKYLKAIDTVGGEPTVGSERLDVTYFLINGWKIKPYSGTYDLTLTGNIFSVDGSSIKVPADIISATVANNIALNLNTSVIVRQLGSTTTSGSGGLLVDERAALFNIEDRVISIQNILSFPVTASLVSSQEQALLDIQSKVAELWKIHGLDADSPMVVTKDGRVVDDITQTFLKPNDDTVIVNREV